MASLVQSAKNSGTTTVTITWGATPTDNNLLVVVGSCRGSDPAISGYTAQINFVSQSQYYKMWYKIASSEAGTISVTNVGGNGGAFIAMEFDGNETSGVADVSATANSGASTVTSQTTGTTATTAQADEVWVGFTGQKASVTWGSWTNSFTHVDYQGHSKASVAASYKIVSSTGTAETTGSWTTAQKAGGGITTFKLSGGAPAAFVPRIMVV